MPQRFAFTTTAMAAALEDTPVSYEELAEIEREFDEAETETSESFLLLPYQACRGAVGLGLIPQAIPLHAQCMRASCHCNRALPCALLHIKPGGSGRQQLTNTPSPPPSRRHQTPLREARAYRIPDPKLLAAGAGAGPAGHRPVHPAVGLGAAARLADGAQRGALRDRGRGRRPAQHCPPLLVRRE